MVRLIYLWRPPLELCLSSRFSQHRLVNGVAASRRIQSGSRTARMKAAGLRFTFAPFRADPQLPPVRSRSQIMEASTPYGARRGRKYFIWLVTLQFSQWIPANLAG